MQLKRDEKAFLSIFNRYNRPLYAWAYRFLKSKEEAEDAVQYTFLKLWEEWGHVDGYAEMRSWLYAIMRNHILNELRHRSLVYEKNYQIAQEFKETDSSFMAMYEECDFRERLQAAINKLPPQKSQICKLKLNFGLSNQEIADKMHIALATVKSHYTQAIKILRQEFIELCVLLIMVVNQ